MKIRPVTFSDRRARYRADTCEPVQAAMRAGALHLAAVAHGAYPGVPLPGSVLPELRCAGCWDAPRAQTWGLDWHRNEGIEFTCLLSGRLDFAVDGRESRLRPGHLTITRPWQEHRVGLPHVEASRLVWVILDVGVRRSNQSWTWPGWIALTPQERDRLTTLLRHNEQPVWASDPGVVDAFRKIAQVAGGAARRFDRTRMVLAVNELLLGILEMLDGRNIPLDDTLTSSQRAVELFLAALPRQLDNAWTVDSMAEHCGLKRSRFTTCCRQLTNRSPAQYLAHCRIEAAMRLLREQPKMSVLDVALDCGFCSSQHFATLFRRHTGCSPLCFRRQECSGG